jgi:hypothetical protein
VLGRSLPFPKNVLVAAWAACATKTVQCHRAEGEGWGSIIRSAWPLHAQRA